VPDSRIFEAQYESPCQGDCGDDVRPGDRVRYVDDDLMHAACASRLLAQLRTSTTPCPDCWTVHAGECL
jgi:hypothetical protein